MSQFNIPSIEELVEEVLNKLINDKNELDDLKSSDNAGVYGIFKPIAIESLEIKIEDRKKLLSKFPSEIRDIKLEKLLK
jgi:hypothetical protein